MKIEPKDHAPKPLTKRFAGIETGDNGIATIIFAALAEREGVNHG